MIIDPFKFCLYITRPRWLRVEWGRAAEWHLL